MNLKKLFLILTVFALALTLFWGCSADLGNERAGGKKLQDGDPEEQAPGGGPPAEERPALEPLGEGYVSVLLTDYEMEYNSGFLNIDIPWWTLWLEEYFGAYNGLHAVWVDGFELGHSPSDSVLSVAGTEFRYRSTNRILLWEYFGQPQEGNRFGKFYELEEAYGLGLLSEGDISGIAYWYNAFAEKLPVNSPEPPPDPEPLSEETVTRIFEDVKSWVAPAFPPSRLLYFGAYNGCVAIHFPLVFSGSRVYETANVPFYYSGPGIIQVWKDGQLYPLHTSPRLAQDYGPDSAYDLGFLSAGDVRNIAYHWNQSFSGLRATELSGGTQ